MKLLVFTQKNCGPCNNLKIHLQAVQSQIPVTISYIDITDNYDIAELFGLKQTPTMFCVEDTGSTKVLTEIYASTTLDIIAVLKLFEG